jgi:hypothetical protein
VTLIREETRSLCHTTPRKPHCRAESIALTDAYRTRFGEPSRQEIHVLLCQRGDVVLLPQDLNGTEHLLPIDRTNLALEHARERSHPTVATTQTPEETLAHGRRLLRGDPKSCAGI